MASAARYTITAVHHYLGADGAERVLYGPLDGPYLYPTREAALLAIANMDGREYWLSHGEHSRPTLRARSVRITWVAAQLWEELR